jgi:hypothetical protein
MLNPVTKKANLGAAARQRIAGQIGISLPAALPGNLPQIRAVK